MTPEEVYFITYPQRFDGLAAAYTKIIARSESEARDIVFREIGSRWAFMYTGQDELTRQANRFRLCPVSLDTARLILINLGELCPHGETE